MDRVRKAVKRALKLAGLRKSFSAERYLGCKISEFREYIEARFSDGMGWHNQGQWHIDHIVPLATANTPEDVLRLCHYSNLQPLWDADNRAKGSLYRGVRVRRTRKLGQTQKRCA